MTTEIDIEKLLNWGAPLRVNTKNGERDLRKAAPTPEFSALWKANKEALGGMGLGWLKDNEGNWIVAWWQMTERAVAEAAMVEASWAADSNQQFPSPEELEYLGYQKAGIAWALKHEGSLIADEMGLGKTIQAIGTINADPKIRTALIVCPASLKINWTKELTKWLVRPMTIQVCGSGTGYGKADITVINYDMLSKFSEVLVAREWDLVVLDESHFIKNGKAQRTKVASQLRGKRRIALTGTPILNKPVELWTTLFWLDPARWTKKKSYFETRFCGAFMSKWGWVNDGATNTEELQRVLRGSVMVRRLKKDVLTELPAKVRQVIELEGDADARRAAKAEMVKWQEFEAAVAQAEAAAEMARLGDSVEEYEKALAKLHDAEGVAFEQMSLVRHQTAQAKAPFVVDFIKELMADDTEKKIVIAAWHKDVVQTLQAGLAEFNPVILVGGMSEGNKQASVDAFQKDPNVRVFIGNIHAAGVGITLTAASHVVFAELDWTPARVTQFEDRCHRIGQTDSVLVQHLVLEGSLDAMMAGKILAKQKVADAVLDKKAAVKIAPEQAKKAQGTKVAVQAPVMEFNQPERKRIDAAHQAMKILAGVCDGAKELDGAGFNKLDTDFGKKLAGAPYLSVRQGEYAIKLARKYRKQLPEALMAVIVPVQS